MRKIYPRWAGIAASLCLLILILDTKTAIKGVLEGLELSARTVIPSLFPFLILSYLINRSFSGIHMPPFFSVLNRFLGIPRGAETIYLLGFAGGYPIGAKNIEMAYCDGCLSGQDARRMLGFCSNAGPAFIFGMASCLFSSQKPLWALWGIHILSSILVAIILPRQKTGTCKMPSKLRISLPDAVNSGIKTMALICGWVITFRVIITFIGRWFLWLFPKSAQAALIGLLELANGCGYLNNLQSEGLRFILCSIFLAFGGLCVAMQTVSVTQQLGSGMYFPGKILQSIFSFIFAVLLQYFLFDRSNVFYFPVVAYILSMILLGTVILLLHRSKKVVAIPI